MFFIVFIRLGMFGLFFAVVVFFLWHVLKCLSFSRFAKTICVRIATLRSGPVRSSPRLFNEHGINLQELLLLVGYSDSEIDCRLYNIPIIAYNSFVPPFVWAREVPMYLPPQQ